MSGADGPVRVGLDGEVAVVELARPERANCMDGPMFGALSDALDQVAETPGVRAVVLCGAGKHLCAGGDLDHPLFSDDDADSRRRQISQAYEVTNRMLDLQVPIVCAIQGRCAGAGLALVLSTDLRIAARSAVFSLDFVRLGVVPDMGLCWLLASTVGTGRALELAMTGDLMGAPQAHEWGIVTAVVDDGREREVAIERARALCAFPPGGLAAIRSLVRTAPFVDRHEAFRQEIDTMTELSATPDARNRLQAFRQRARGATR